MFFVQVYSMETFPPVKEASHPTRKWLVSPKAIVAQLYQGALLVWQQVSTVTHCIRPLMSSLRRSTTRTKKNVFPSQSQLGFFMTPKHGVFSAIALSYWESCHPITDSPENSNSLDLCCLGGFWVSLTIASWEVSCAWHWDSCLKAISKHYYLTAYNEWVLWPGRMRVPFR